MLKIVVDLLWTNSHKACAYHKFAIGLSDCRSRSQIDYRCPAVQIVHRIATKCLRNVPKVFDICSEIKRDRKSHFGFVVQTFSEFVNAEIATSSIIADVIRLPVTVSRRQNVDSHKARSIQ